MVNAGDAGALWFVLRAGMYRSQLEDQPSRKKNYGVLEIDSRDADKALHESDSNLSVALPTNHCGGPGCGPV